MNLMDNMKFTSLLSLFLMAITTLTTFAADKPNLVLIVADDCTYLDLELYYFLTITILGATTNCMKH